MSCRRTKCAYIRRAATVAEGLLTATARIDGQKLYQNEIEKAKQFAAGDQQK